MRAFQRGGSALLALLAASTACATMSAGDVHRAGERGDLERVLDAWAKADTDAVRVAVIEELAAHPEDTRGQKLVVRQAGAASSEPVKLAAVKALGAYAGPEPVGAAIEALRDPWPAVRAVAEATLHARAAEAGPALVAALSSHTSHLVRSASARLLVASVALKSELRAPAEAAILERGTRDDAPRVREAAVAALGNLTWGGASPAPGGELQVRLGAARARIVELLRADADPGVRMAAERALAKLGGEVASSAVVAVLPLRNDTGLRDPEIERLGKEVADYVAARLSASKACQVVDREKVELAIQELKKVGAAMYDGDAPNAPAIGRFKIANQLVFGFIQRQGATFTIVLDRMDLSTLAHVPGAAVTVAGYRPDLGQLKARAAEELVASFR